MRQSKPTYDKEIVALVDQLALPSRPAKPRQDGMTVLLDKGLSCREVEDLLEVCSEHIDLVKLGWGTALVTPALRRKLAVYRNAGIPAYFGGTLFEACYFRGLLDSYRRFLASLDIHHVEVSDGTLEIPHHDKLNCIKILGEDFVVISEVGSKDPNLTMPPDRWVELIRAELEAGSWKVICEARESGTAGVCHSNGALRSGLLEEILTQIDSSRLILEAPLKEQQVWFLRRLGPNANLGNIAPEEVVSLETLRLGLRSDTLLDALCSWQKLPAIAIVQSAGGCDPAGLLAARG